MCGNFRILQSRPGHQLTVHFLAALLSRTTDTEIELSKGYNKCSAGYCSSKLRDLLLAMGIC